MIYVINNNNDPFFNHAVEEYLMNNFDEEIFMLWINKPSILIGRNQNTISEINIDYIEENGIIVVCICQLKTIPYFNRKLGQL
ncbi:lipoate--protein ligase family protein, partial [Anaerosalibacter bizertensis]|uniref:lipoate--protein ligase family protein n=1 Tax=Anaerosalibacter bizertensis TaxID=932217 RepID=UPI00231CD4D1|nr:hypothetical protein [Anaerosalibacter bizertensis]